jgi:hypothetical protein
MTAQIGFDENVTDDTGVIRIHPAGAENVPAKLSELFGAGLHLGPFADSPVIR